MSNECNDFDYAVVMAPPARHHTTGNNLTLWHSMFFCALHRNRLNALNVNLVCSNKLWMPFQIHTIFFHSSCDLLFIINSKHLMKLIFLMNDFPDVSVLYFELFNYRSEDDGNAVERKCQISFRTDCHLFTMSIWIEVIEWLVKAVLSTRLELTNLLCLIILFT